MDTKYELIKPIGHGAYGVVISALNTETGQKVAIKKITHAFYDLVDAKRILREIKLLRNFSHENVSSFIALSIAGGEGFRRLSSQYAKFPGRHDYCFNPACISAT